MVGYLAAEEVPRHRDRPARQAAGILDFRRPVALILFGIMGNVTDNDLAAAIGGCPGHEGHAGVLEHARRAEQQRLAQEDDQEAGVYGVAQLAGQACHHQARRRYQRCRGTLRRGRTG